MKTPINAVQVLMEKPEEKPKPVYVDEIQNTDNVGILLGGNKKVYVIQIGDLIFKASTIYGSNNCCNLTEGGAEFNRIIDVIDYVNNNREIVSVYKFTTRRDLYKWLAED